MWLGGVKGSANWKDSTRGKARSSSCASLAASRFRRSAPPWEFQLRPSSANGLSQKCGSIGNYHARIDSMDAQRWQRLKSILNDAFEEESTSARLAFVERSCSDDHALLQEAESLLAEAEILRRSASDDLEACAENAARRIQRDAVSRIGKRI